MKASEEQVLTASLAACSVQEAILALRVTLEVDHLTCHLISAGPGPVSNPFVRTTYPSDWVSHYLLNNLVRSDPVLGRAMTAEHPFFWDELALTPPQREMVAMARRFGVGTSGYTVPCIDALGRRSVLSLNGTAASGAWRERMAPLTALLSSLAGDLHVKAIGEAFAQGNCGRSLSPRELECLRWTAAGKTYPEIAVILGLSEHTVRGYLKDVRLKLDAVSLAQAVGTAAVLGLV